MNKPSPSKSLILASSSKYRKKLLQRLQISFTCQSPETDESAGTGESPHELVARLAAQKARVVASEHPTAVVIGSDQVAVFNGLVVGKPGHYQAALEQLTSFSGQVVEFLTAVSVQHAQSGFDSQHTDLTRVFFRSLQLEEIQRYLSIEQPYDCAGAFKAESLGIVLFDRIVSDDPTALIGLPLVRTAKLLRAAGWQLP